MAPDPGVAITLNLPAHQLGRQRRQPVILIFGPAKFDRHILPFDEARLFQTLPKSGDVWRPQGVPLLVHCWLAQTKTA
jgi:hypothetical protein